jgi:hypothetical protein
MSRYIYICVQPIAETCPNHRFVVNYITMFLFEFGLCTDGLENKKKSQNLPIMTFACDCTCYLMKYKFGI